MTGTVLWAVTAVTAVTGFLGAGLFFSTNALATGFLLRIGAGAPALGVVEFGPEGGVGAAELLMLAGEYQGASGASDGAMVRAASGSSGMSFLSVGGCWINVVAAVVEVGDSCMSDSEVDVDFWAWSRG